MCEDFVDSGAVATGRKREDQRLAQRARVGLARRLGVQKVEGDRHELGGGLSRFRQRSAEFVPRFRRVFEKFRFQIEFSHQRAM